MFTISTKWGELRFPLEETNAVVDCLQAEIDRAQQINRQRIVLQREEFTAFTVEIPDVGAKKAEVRFSAYMDEVDCWWSVKSLKEYEIDGQRYKAHWDDFVFEFDIENIDWYAERSTQKKFGAKAIGVATVFIVASQAQLAARMLN